MEFVLYVGSIKRVYKHQKQCTAAEHLCFVAAGSWVGLLISVILAIFPDV